MIGKCSTFRHNVKISPKAYEELKRIAEDDCISLKSALDFIILTYRKREGR